MMQSENINELAAALAKAQSAGDRFAEAALIPALLRERNGPHKGNQNSGRDLLARFYSKVAFGLSDCWLWWGHIDALGYGRLVYPGESKAHRASWRIHCGAIPDGMKVLHRCDVRSCVNPNHLFLGTQEANVRDMIAKGRQRFPTPRHGEANPMSRLTARHVAEIRRRYAAGGITMAELASEYGVATMTVQRALRGTSWTTV